MLSKKLRVVILIRVSTKSQAVRKGGNKEELDIPDQRAVIMEHVNRNGWTVVREFVETLSGFKVSANDRDALQTIKAMAENNEFDVLCIYYSDRLGRIEDETPLVISFLNQHNVRVYSCSEGWIDNNTHQDKLITYLRYWMASGESRKTSKRVTDTMVQMTKTGRFRGGTLAYGYKYVDNGTLNPKGQPIYDVVIDEEEAKVIKMIFNLSIVSNYGQRRVAQYLNDNGYRTREGRLWTPMNVRHIFNNKMYKGILEMNSKIYNEQYLSPVREDLIIIDPEEWDRNQKILAKRITKTKSGHTERTTNGKMLLSGIAYCMDCGGKLTTFAQIKKKVRADGTVNKSILNKYRCYNKAYRPKEGNCTGKSIHSATRVDSIVIAETKQFIVQLQDKTLDDSFYEDIKKQISEETRRRQRTQIALTQLYKEENALNQEVVKAVMGTSAFQPDVLNQLLETKKLEIQVANDKMSILDKKINELKEELNSYKKLGDDLIDWEQKFDQADDARKKEMILAVVERVDVGRDEIRIKFNVRLETYKNQGVSKECSRSPKYTHFTHTTTVKVA